MFSERGLGLLWPHLPCCVLKFDSHRPGPAGSGVVVEEHSPSRGEGEHVQVGPRHGGLQVAAVRAPALAAGRGGLHHRVAPLVAGVQVQAEGLPQLLVGSPQSPHGGVPVALPGHALGAGVRMVLCTNTSGQRGQTSLRTVLG